MGDITYSVWVFLGNKNKARMRPRRSVPATSLSTCRGEPLYSRQAIVPSLTDGSTGVGMRFATRPSGYPPSLWLFMWTMAGTVAIRLDI
jgi:hypothetical protein